MFRKQLVKFFESAVFSYVKSEIMKVYRCAANYTTEIVLVEEQK